jgi:hypothetical protein
MTLYLLKLRDDCYFVTNDPTNYENEWTKLHPYVSIQSQIPYQDGYDIDKYTLIYMNRYGLDHVRGGTFSAPQLDLHEIALIKQMSATAVQFWPHTLKKSSYAQPSVLKPYIITTTPCDFDIPPPEPKLEHVTTLRPLYYNQIPLVTNMVSHVSTLSGREIDHTQYISTTSRLGTQHIYSHNSMLNSLSFGSGPASS